MTIAVVQSYCFVQQEQEQEQREKESAHFVTHKRIDSSALAEEFKPKSEAVEDLTELLSTGDIKLHSRQIYQALTRAYRNGGNENINRLMGQVSINLDLKKDGMGVVEAPRQFGEKHLQARFFIVVDKNDHEVAKFSWWPEPQHR